MVLQPLMIEPQRIGRFLATDELGYVKPDVAMDLIGPVWRPFVDFVAGALMRRNGVYSVYIRGSIPRGLAIENISDADFIYISEQDFERQDHAMEVAAKARFPFARDIKVFRLSRAEFRKIHHPQRRPYFHMLLKTQSLFLAGEDVTKSIEPFKLGPDMVSHVFALASEFAKSQAWLSRLPAALPDQQKQSLERSMHVWICKRIARSGFEVTMNRTDRFTRDLYLCYEQFAEFYPERAEQMYDVLVNCLTGEKNPAPYGELVEFLVREGLRLLPQG